jgi:hypothetical protein
MRKPTAIGKVVDPFLRILPLPDINIPGAKLADIDAERRELLMRHCIPRISSRRITDRSNGLPDRDSIFLAARSREISE